MHADRPTPTWLRALEIVCCGGVPLLLIVRTSADGLAAVASWLGGAWFDALLVMVRAIAIFVWSRPSASGATTAHHDAGDHNECRHADWASEASICRAHTEYWRNPCA